MTKKSHGISVRTAGFDDAQAVFQLVREFPRELVARPINDIVQNIDRCLVAEDDGRVVGTVSWQVLPEIGLAADPTVEIKSLSVRKDSHGRGIGRALVGEAIRRIGVLKPSKIIVLTFTPEFFGKFGFKVIAKQEIMHKLYTGCSNCTKYDSPFTCPEIAMSLEMPGRKRGKASAGNAV